MRRIFLLVALLSSSQIFSSTAEEISNFEEDMIDSFEGTENLSGLFVESNTCGPSYASCIDASPCFDHSLGCAEDGTIIFEDCAAAQPCKPCFPNSRCSSDSSPEAPHNENVSAIFVESESCGPEFATCAQAAPCFDHSLGCAEDGSVVFPQCSTALPFCKPCFPNSRCSSDSSPEAPGNENVSAVFVESESCGPEFATCAQAGPCFDHSLGCAEDGTIIFEDCAAAQPCKPCFPNSRCSSVSSPEAPDNENVSAIFVESEDAKSGARSFATETAALLTIIATGILRY